MWDGIIVGGGLAGLIAGIRASERGKSILIISEGIGSLTYSSGVIDFGDVRGLMRVEKHPYALLGETVVRSGIEYVQTLLPEYQGGWERRQKVLTPLGSLRNAGFVPKALKTEALQDARQIMLVAPEGMKDFFPEVIKANLESAYPQSVVKVVPLRVPQFESWYVLGKSVTGMDYAKFWRSFPGIEVLQGLLSRLALEIVGENQVVVFPGLVSEFSNSLKDCLSKAPFPIVEITAFPPSASGDILYETLKLKFRSLGGELLVGTGVKHVELRGKKCHRVIVQSKGRDTSFGAHSFVLATGGIFGGGIEVTPDVAREKVFGFPLFVPSDWTGSDFLGDQPYSRMGIEVDGNLRPLDPRSGDVLMENVRVIGRQLAHWDPWVECCGGGVSLASGWLAGEMI